MMHVFFITFSIFVSLIVIIMIRDIFMKNHNFIKIVGLVRIDGQIFLRIKYNTSFPDVYIKYRVFDYDPAKPPNAFVFNKNDMRTLEKAEHGRFILDCPYMDSINTPLIAYIILQRTDGTVIGKDYSRIV